MAKRVEELFPQQLGGENDSGRSALGNSPHLKRGATSGLSLPHCSIVDTSDHLAQRKELVGIVEVVSGCVLDGELLDVTVDTATAHVTAQLDNPRAVRDGLHVHPGRVNH